MSNLRGNYTVWGEIDPELVVRDVRTPIENSRLPTSVTLVEPGHEAWYSMVPAQLPPQTSATFNPPDRPASELVVHDISLPLPNSGYRETVRHELAHHRINVRAPLLDRSRLPGRPVPKIYGDQETANFNKHFRGFYRYHGYLIPRVPPPRESDLPDSFSAAAELNRLDMYQRMMLGIFLTPCTGDLRLVHFMRCLEMALAQDDQYSAFPLNEWNRDLTMEIIGHAITQ